MRIAGIGAKRHIGCGIADEPFFLEPLHHLLLQVELRQTLAILQRAAGAIERAILDAIERSGRAHVRGQLRGRPRGFEALHEIAGGDDLHAARANQFGRAGIDA